MEYLEIKVEKEEKFNQHCPTCLSIGRKMAPLGKLANIYRSLTCDYEFIAINSTELLLLCWECHAFLNNIKKFKCQLQKANERLRLGQNYLHSLSNLTTVILNSDQPNALYVFDQMLENNTLKAEMCTTKPLNSVLFINSEEEDDDSFNCNNDFQNYDEKKDISTENSIELAHSKNTEGDSKKEKTINNKWAKKRALQNKKPKFKVITERKKCINTIFSKLQLYEEDLQRHVLIERESENFNSKKFRCDKCLSGFNERKILLKHMKHLHDETVGLYICDICCKRISDKQSLSKHIQNHYFMYKCRVCSYVCYDKKHRWRHVATSHRRILQCLKCETLFGSRREFFQHFKDWHEKFICDQCGVSFKMRYCIKDHIMKQHSLFECKPCSKRFARYNGLWLHNKIQHGAPASPAYCVECDRRYPDYYRYKWHLANSARHRPRQKLRIPCPECDKVFSKNIYMKDHYNLVHLKNFKYRCEECNKNFIRNADLTKHNRRVHEGIMPPRNKICYMCGRGFTTNKILANHLRTHTGERPFACTQCAARFAQAAALASHLRALHSR